MRFKIEASQSKPDYWVCSDFLNKILCIFKDGDFNDQVFEYLNDEDRITGDELAEAKRELGDWLRENHYCKLFPCDIRLRIGQQIKYLRLRNKWTIRELEERSGVAAKNISAIENGKYNIRLDTIEKMESTFNVKFSLVDNKAVMFIT